jgi:hypothetical protein
MRKKVLLIGTNDGIDVIEGTIKVLILLEKGVDFFFGGTYFIRSLIVTRVDLDFNLIALWRGIAALDRKNIPYGRTKPFINLKAIEAFRKFRHHSPMLFRTLFQRCPSASKDSIVKREYERLNVKVLWAIIEIRLKGKIE